MKKKNNNSSGLSRREFIKATSISTIGLSFLGAMPSGLRESLTSNVLSKSRIVIVRNPKVVDENGIVDSALLKEMIQAALEKFGGEKSYSEFLRKKFTPNETMGLKINTLGLNSITGTNLTDHFSAFTTAIMDNLKDAGIKDENFIIWDRSEEELKSAGLQIQKEKGMVRVIASVETRRGEGGIGYTNEEFAVGEKKTQLAKILTEMCSTIINIPVLKDHGNAGFTGALKNHYGSISNAREFHSNNCTAPGIPEINMIPEIQNKQRLIITDALMGVFNGGPRWERKFMWPFGGVLVGTDPVAMDTVMLNIINEKRKSEGMPAISENVTKHIRLSKELGLGTNDMNEIDLVEINI